MNNSKIYFECACWSPDHIFSVSKDSETDELYLIMHLTKFKWYQRIIVAIKYIFNKTSKFGCFEEIILNKDSRQKLKELL